MSAFEAPLFAQDVSAESIFGASLEGENQVGIFSDVHFL